jgi:broad specificity phosphatase PhoE
MTTRLLLTRHGETVANAARRYAGHSESDLTALGRRQARALGRRLAYERIDAVYASDLQRALETARLCLGSRELEVFVEPRLREMSFGEWEGLTFDEIRSGWPDHHHLMRTIGDEFHAPGGEPFTETKRRVIEAVEELFARYNDETVLLVAHGGTLQIVLQYLLGLPDSAIFRLSTSNCGLSVAEFSQGRAVVTRVNDTSHLEPRRRRSATK